MDRHGCHLPLIAWAIAGVVACGGLSAPASAALVAWDGGSAVSSDWMAGANWSDDTQPSSANTYTISTTTPRAAVTSATAFLGGGLTLSAGGSLKMGQATSTMSNGGLTLAGGTLICDRGGSLNYLYIKNASSLVIADGTSSTVNVTGSINGSYSDWFGVVAGGGGSYTASGSGTLVKTGGGILSLPAAWAGSSFTGTANVQAGGLAPTAGTDLHWLADATINVSGTGRLMPRDGTETFNHLTLSGGGIAQYPWSGGAITLAGQLNVTARSFLETGMTLSSTLSGAGNLVLNAQSITLKLASGMDMSGYSGALEFAAAGEWLDVNGNTLALAGLHSAAYACGNVGNSASGSAPTLTLRPPVGTTYTFSGRISNTTGTGTGTLALAIDGPGTQVLSPVAGYANQFTGGVTINSGTLQLGSNNNPLGSEGAIVVNGGGTLKLASGVSLGRGPTVNAGGVMDLGGGTLSGLLVMASTGRLIGSGSYGGGSGSGSGALQGIVSPGNTAGTISIITNPATLGGTYEWELLGDNATARDNSTTGRVGTPGTHWDLLTANGTTLTFASPAALTLAGGSYTPNADAWWDSSHRWTIASATAGGSISLGSLAMPSGNGQGAFSAVIDSGSLVLAWQPGNDSVLYVGPAAPTANDQTTTTTVDFGKVLRGSTPASTDVTLHKLGSSSTTASLTVSGLARTTTASPMSLAGGAGDYAVHVTLTTADFARDGSVTIDNLASDSGGTSQGSRNGNATVNVVATVGWALAKANPADRLDFDAGERLMAAGATSLAGLESAVSNGQGAPYLGVLGTSARLLDGVVPSGTVSMNWRARLADEVARDQYGLASDVLNLDLGSGYTGQTFVLEMSYSDQAPAIAGTEADLVDRRAIHIRWWDGAAWVRASGELGEYRGQVAWNSAFTTVGDWGIQPGVEGDGGTAWVVLNHAGQFAVVPEPATVAMLAVGGLLLPMLRRRRVK